MVEGKSGLFGKFFRLLFRPKAAPLTPPPRRRTPFVILPDEIHRFRKFPEPRWDVIFARVDACPNDFSSNDYTCDAVEQWLELLASSLGPEYEVFESETCFVVHPADTGESAVCFVEQACGEIRNILGPLAGQANAGKHVVIGFNRLRDYYTYISAFYPEAGLFGTSIGCCIRQTGYTHVAYVCGWDDRSTIGHELVHCLLSHRQVPLWIEEGLAQLIDLRVSGKPSLVFDSEQMGQLYRCWRRRGLAEFWSGQSFAQLGDVQRHSYVLAYILVLKLMERHKQSFSMFVERADRDDAGESAATEVLRCRLGSVVAEVFGDGKWAPDVESIRSTMITSADDRSKEQPNSGTN